MNIRKLYFLPFLILFLFTTKVNASSVTYELNIDEDRTFYETITYTIEKNTENEYLKSIISNPVYYDINNTIPYNKKVNRNSNNIIVVLKHSYDEKSLNNSRIVNKCFNKPVINIDEYHISFYSNLPLKCNDVTDDILIKITTSIDVMNNNADLIENQTYTWDKLKETPVFHISVGTIDPNLNVLPPMPCSNCEHKYVVIDAENVPRYDTTYIFQGIMIISVIYVGVIIVTIKKRKSSRNIRLKGDFYNNY